MATQKNYIWNGGTIEESDSQIDMIGWEYVQDGFTKRIVNESTGVYNHAKFAESKYIIQVNVSGHWATVSNDNAIISMGTYCENTPPFNSLSESEAYETIDEVKVLKSTSAIEWEFYYPVFFNPLSTGANLYNFVKRGAELKTGISL